MHPSILPRPALASASHASLHSPPSLRALSVRRALTPISPLVPSHPPIHPILAHPPRSLALTPIHPLSPRCSASALPM